MAKKDSEAAPTPDPAIGAAALKQAQLGDDWLGFAKDAFQVSTQRQAALDDLTKQVTSKQIGLADEAAANSRADRQRYETTFQPVEDKFVADAANYATPERQAEAAAQAGADVRTAAAGARGAADRQAAALGIDPTSGRFAGIQRSGELGTALGVAGAENTARESVRDKGLALTQDVINLGHGLPAQAASEAGQAAGLGSSAVGLTGSANGQANANTAIMGQGFSGAQQGYGGQASTLNSLFNSQLNSYNAQQQADANNAAGFGSAIGTGLGLILSDENVKEDKTPIGEGDALEAVNAMPVEAWNYKEGAGDGGAHVGTYAQDFQRATGKGDGHTIPVQDAIGITMKAVQDLAKQVERVSAAVGLGDVEPAGAAPPMAKRPAKLPPANDNAGAMPAAIGLG